MTIRCGLRIEFGDHKPSLNVRIEVNDDDETILHGFAEDSARLFDSLAAMGDMRVALQVAVDNVAGTVKTAVTEPSDDQRAILLHRLRPLILKKEPWSFDRTCGALARATNHPFMREKLREIRDIYSGKTLREQAVISKGGLILNSDVAFDRWTNAFEYHRDLDGRAELKPADDPLPFEATRAVILDLLIEKIGAIHRVAQLTTAILKKPTRTAST